jgi:hypothetical protein
MDDPMDDRRDHVRQVRERIGGDGLQKASRGLRKAAGALQKAARRLPKAAGALP